MKRDLHESPHLAPVAEYEPGEFIPSTRQNVSRRDEEATYEVQAEDLSATVVGDDTLLHILSRYKGRPVTVTRRDSDRYVPYYVEEQAIQAGVYDRNTGEVHING